jgi:hypothetical protein
MSSFFDSDLLQQLRIIRDMAALQHQTPIHEWPLLFVEEHGLLLVVREWPNGAITCYVAARDST